MLQAKLTITGKVQGVGYRFQAQKMAQQLGLCGWVKNEADGSVSALVQGSQGPLQEFINWCHTGPSGAYVEEVKIVLEPMVENLKGFDIKY